VAGAQAQGAERIHATCVALDGRAALITGASGSGKSALGLALIARGAALVADDQTLLTPENGRVIASCPAPIRGMIEARGLGLLSAPPAPPTPVELVIDLDHVEKERLPRRRNRSIVNIPLPLIHKIESSHFVDAVIIYLRYGRSL